MTIDEQIEIRTKQGYVVSKSNSLIQKSRYELSLQEQRAIAYICSKIKPIDTLKKKTQIELEYEFDILEYAKICEVSADNGRVYEEIKALLKGLITKVMWLTLEDGTETTVNWINKVWTNKKSGIAKIRIDEDMIPYLFGLQEKFTAYGLYNILKMKSQYSIRLFEILKSYEWLNQKSFDLKQLKKMLMVDAKSYDNFAEFKRRVIEPAVKEINELSDLYISYESVKKGRKVDKLIFTIKNKTKKYQAIAIKKEKG